jgi:hypothetical protein
MCIPTKHTILGASKSWAMLSCTGTDTLQSIENDWLKKGTTVLSNIQMHKKVICWRFFIVMRADVDFMDQFPLPIGTIIARTLYHN